MFNSKSKLFDNKKRNYIIPHRTPRYSNYTTWKLSYKNHLVNLYGVFASSINNRYDNDVNWDSDEVFENFCKFAYDSSSKYISPWNKVTYEDWKD
jgi:hypothetical protein